MGKPSTLTAPVRSAFHPQARPSRPGGLWPLGDSPPNPKAGCPGHRYNVVVDFKDNASGGGAFGRGAENNTETVYVNDYHATPANAPTILRAMAKRGGFSIGPTPVADQK